MKKTNILTGKTTLILITGNKKNSEKVISEITYKTLDFALQAINSIMDRATIKEIKSVKNHVEIELENKNNLSITKTIKLITLD